MKVWLVRHGQTDLNKKHLMQGRSDCPLNETGRAQAAAAGEKVKDVSFDRVFSSPLQRAVTTASIISGIPEENVVRDERLIETDFGKCEKRPYLLVGLPMSLYWAFPEIFPAPATVETIASMVERSSSFLNELKDMPYENVLVSCHGGIMRALCGCLEERPRGILWRPRPHNCEFRVYETDGGGWVRRE